MSLSELAAKVKKHERDSVEIDVSEYLDLPEGAEPVRIVIGEPYPYNLNQAAQRARDVRRANPLVDDESAYHCSLFASCHQQPASKEESAEGKYRDALAFYVAIARDNIPAFMKMRTQFYARFAWLKSLWASEQEEESE